MLSRSMHKGALITREAYLALLDLKSLIDGAAEKAHVAGLDSAGLTVSLQPIGDPLGALKMASDTLQSPAFESAVAEARSKIDSAMVWHTEATGSLPKP